MRKRKPLQENAHTAKMFTYFLQQKKAPAGKCTHGKKNVLQWSLAAAQWSLATAQWSLAAAQWSLAAAQWSLAAAQESKNTRKIVGFFITWLLYSQDPSRSNMAQQCRLIVWI